MVALRFTAAQADGTTRTTEVQAQPGHTAMQAAVAAGIDGVAADCGGMLTCGTCHVYVDPAWADRLPPADDEEQAMLEFTAAPRRAHSRLSCQIVLQPEFDGLTLELPERQY
jgi:2Fe-2S ferredoxin